MPKMSLLTEFWKVGLRGLQRCHAYGVSGKPPMHQGFLGTMHHLWWLVSPAEPGHSKPDLRPFLPVSPVSAWQGRYFCQTWLVVIMAIFEAASLPVMATLS